MKIKQFFKTNALAIAAIIFAGTTMSFKLAERKAAPQDFYYNSNDISANAFHNVANWNTTMPADCSTEEPVRPCKVTVPEGSTLSSVLGSKTNSQVLAISQGYRPAP